MSDYEKHAITIEAVEREIASGTLRLAFAPEIESIFERSTRAPRTRMLCVTGIAAAILYDLSVVVDWVTLRDMAWFMTFARFFIFTPVLALVVFVGSRGPTAVVRESLAASVGILGVFLPMVAMVFSQSPQRLSYQYGSLLVMLFCSVVQRLRFRFSLAALGCMLTIQLATTYASGAFDAETYLGIVLFFVTASVLMVLTMYFFEQSERRSFLLALRGEFLREQVEIGARTDALTGLFNRRHLGDVQGELWAAAGTEPRSVSAILLDIDHFKLFNDSRGHLEGDACLRCVSDRVRTVARDRNGLAFRFGGEEMLVLLPDIGIADAVGTAESIRAAIEGAAIPHPAAGGVVTASLGVAGTVAPETTADDLIAAADAALYTAKRAGRNQVRPWAAPRPVLPPENRSAA